MASWESRIGIFILQPARFNSLLAQRDLPANFAVHGEPLLPSCVSSFSYFGQNSVKSSCLDKQWIHVRVGVPLLLDVSFNSNLVGTRQLAGSSLKVPSLKKIGAVYSAHEHFFLLSHLNLWPLNLK